MNISPSLEFDACIKLSFHAEYSNAELLSNDVLHIELPSFPFEIVGVESLPRIPIGIRRPVYGQADIVLLVIPSSDIGHCHIYASPKKFMLRDNERWLYSYHASKGILHKINR